MPEPYQIEQLGTLSLSMEEIRKQKSSKPLSEEWQRTIAHLDRLGAEKQEEFRRKAHRAYIEAERMIHGDPEYPR